MMISYDIMILTVPIRILCVHTFCAFPSGSWPFRVCLSKMARLLCAVPNKAQRLLTNDAVLSELSELWKRLSRLHHVNLAIGRTLRDFEEIRNKAAQGSFYWILLFHGQKRKIDRQHSEEQHDGRDSFYRNAPVMRPYLQKKLKYCAWKNCRT